MKHQTGLLRGPGWPAVLIAGPIAASGFLCLPAKAHAAGFWCYYPQVKQSPCTTFGQLYGSSGWKDYRSQDRVKVSASNYWGGNDVFFRLWRATIAHVVEKNGDTNWYLPAGANDYYLITNPITRQNLIYVDDIPPGTNGSVFTTSTYYPY